MSTIWKDCSGQAEEEEFNRQPQPQEVKSRGALSCLTLFKRIKLRSTGRASNLTTPTTDFSPEISKSFQADVKAVKLDPNDAL